ncbi:Zinc finger protein DPF3 [Varanus komodoensis]|nr:Zinc finger protein DPF3 [Varanus komodoensis]
MRKVSPLIPARGSGGGRRRADVSSMDDHDKPYVCDICGKRYKNRPGLSYHYAHTHLASEEGDDAREQETRSPPVHRNENHKRLAATQCGKEVAEATQKSLYVPSGKVNLDSILKSRDITLPTKVCIVKAMVFPVTMYGCESWTIRKAECQRTEAFELWCWRRLLRVPWTARRSNRSVLEEINPDCSLEGQILKMKLKYFGHLMRRKDSLEKSLMLGTIDGKRRRGRQRMRWLDGVTEAVGVSLGGLPGIVEDRKTWRNVVHGFAIGRT